MKPTHIFFLKRGNPIFQRITCSLYIYIYIYIYTKKKKPLSQWTLPYKLRTIFENYYNEVQSYSQKFPLVILKKGEKIKIISTYKVILKKLWITWFFFVRIKHV